MRFARGIISIITAIIFGATIGEIVFGDSVEVGMVLWGLSLTIAGVFTVCVGLQERKEER